VPSFFGTNTIGEPHGEELGLMTPWFNNSCTCFLISSISNEDILYMPIWVKEHPVEDGSHVGFPFGRKSTWFLKNLIIVRNNSNNSFYEWDHNLGKHQMSQHIFLSQP
jgi:hypothetical protein